MKKTGIVLLLASALCLGGCAQQTQVSYYQQGMEQIDNGYYHEALAEFQRAINAKEEGSVLIYRGAGMAYMGMGEYSNALTAFDKAIDLAGNGMKKAVNDILKYKVSALYHMEDYETAIETCQTLLKRDKKNGEIYFLRGASYLMSGKSEEAKADFDAAVSYSPQDYELYLSIYECYDNLNLSAEGDEYLQQALNLDDNSVDARYERARIYYYLEEYDHAKDELLEAVNNKDKDCMLLMGKVYLAQEDYEHARALYQEYMQDIEEAPIAYNGLVLCDIGENDLDAALKQVALGLALESESGKQELRYNEIVIYEKKADFETAKQKAEEYTALYPSDKAGLREYQFLSSR